MDVKVIFRNTVQIQVTFAHYFSARGTCGNKESHTCTQVPRSHINRLVFAVCFRPQKKRSSNPLQWLIWTVLWWTVHRHCFSLFSQHTLVILPSLDVYMGIFRQGKTYEVGDWPSFKASWNALPGNSCTFLLCMCQKQKWSSVICMWQQHERCTVITSLLQIWKQGMAV